MNNLGRHMRAARIVRGYTLAQLGERIGVSHNTISKYERGRITKPPVDRLIAIGQVLRIDPLWLIGTSPSPTEYRDVNQIIAQTEQHLDELYTRVGVNRKAIKDTPQA